ncbi:MAG: saccharopine dehydrogenase, partial [Bacteroidales bacterium]|nr:saccharopine dehydrogenase [Bacteroidales bacterium]
GVLLLNETGLDPGIDHMSAMKIIDQVHDNGGSIEKFFSLCGALPAPEAADNPFKYKFSWSPGGVILASRNSALYLRDKQKIYIDPEDLFRDRFTCNFPEIGELEVYPNRDSISYIDIYGIPEVSTMYRGTFRYKGWCETLDVMKRLNMLDDKVISCKGKSYAEFFAETAAAGTADLSIYLKTKMGITVDSVPFKALEFLGFFSNEIMDYEEISPMEVTAGRMIELMTIGDNDRDMVAMQHIFLAGYPSGQKEVIKSSMLDFGSPSSDTAIARTVGLPAAIAVRLILENKITLSGVHRPVAPQIYNPVLDELRTLGIEIKEESGLPESELMIF